MTQIEGNHVALVVEGRAGPDVLVADSQIQPPGKVRTVKLNPKQLAALKKRMPQLKVAMDEGLDTEAAETALEEALEEVQALGEDPTQAQDNGNAEVVGLLKQLLAKLEGNGGANDEDEEATRKAAQDEEARIGFTDLDDDHVDLALDDSDNERPVQGKKNQRTYRDEFTDNDSDEFPGEADETYGLHSHVQRG